MKTFLIFIFLTISIGYANEDIKRLEALRNVIEKDIIPYLLSYEKKLLDKLAILVKNHLDCCIVGVGILGIDILGIDKYYARVRRVNEELVYFDSWASTRIYFLPDTPIFTLRQVLSISKIGTEKPKKIVPPIQLPEIRELFGRIKVVREKRKRLQEYVEEIVYTISNLKMAYAMQSSDLPSLRKKARALIWKIEKELRRAK